MSGRRYPALGAAFLRNQIVFDIGQRVHHAMLLGADESIHFHRLRQGEIRSHLHRDLGRGERRLCKAAAAQ